MYRWIFQSFTCNTKENQSAGSKFFFSTLKIGDPFILFTRFFMRLTLEKLMEKNEGFLSLCNSDLKKLLL